MKVVNERKAPSFVIIAMISMLLMATPSLTFADCVNFNGIFNSQTTFNPQSTWNLGQNNTSTQTVELNLTPLKSNIDGVIAYADTLTSISNFSNNSILIKMDTDGMFKVYKGQASIYAFDGTGVPYTANNTYHVKIVTDINNKTYDVWIDTTKIANQYSYRSSAPVMNDIGQVSFISNVPLTNNNFMVQNHNVYATTGSPGTIQYGYIPPAQTVHGGTTPINVPAGYIHQTAWAASGNKPDIQGVYAYPFGGWNSLVWRWADTMRTNSIQHVASAPVSAKPAYRFEITRNDHASPGTAGDHPRAEFFSVSAAEDRRDPPPPQRRTSSSKGRNIGLPSRSTSHQISLRITCGQRWSRESSRTT
jgi:hypothetical protein